MPRQESTERTLYQFGELAEDMQAKALQNCADMRARCWDSYDSDRIGEAIAYAIGDVFGDPANRTRGEGDYELPAGVKLTEWDIDRSSTVKLSGTIGPEGAPALPWPTGEDVNTWITFGDPDYGRHVVAHAECECERAYLGDGNYESCPHIFALGALQDAAEQALQAGLSAGRTEYEYMFSDDAMREDIEANEREFTADGRLA